MAYVVYKEFITVLRLNALGGLWVKEQGHNSVIFFFYFRPQRSSVSVIARVVTCSRPMLGAPGCVVLGPLRAVAGVHSTLERVTPLSRVVLR